MDIRQLVTSSSDYAQISYQSTRNRCVSAIVVKSSIHLVEFGASVAVSTITVVYSTEERKHKLRMKRLAHVLRMYNDEDDGFDDSFE